MRIDQAWKSKIARGSTPKAEIQAQRTSGPGAKPKASPESQSSTRHLPPQPKRPRVNKSKSVMQKEIINKPTVENEPQIVETAPIVPEVKTYRRVIVHDSGTLLADKTRISLAGLKPIEHHTMCQKAPKKTWPCGKQARLSLQRLIRSRSVNCTVVERQSKGSFTAQCAVGKRNINQWVVRQGWAKPYDLASAIYGQSLQKAKNERNGIWKYDDSSLTDS